MQKHVSALYVEFFRIWRGLQPGAKHPVCLTSINNHPITKADFIVNINLLNKKDAERIFEDNLNSRHNPNLKLGAIKDQGSSFEADLLTKDNSLVDKLIVDKNTGRMRSAY
jgi:hypothetical protein